MTSTLWNPILYAALNEQLRNGGIDCLPHCIKSCLRVNVSPTALAPAPSGRTSRLRQGSELTLALGDVTNRDGDTTGRLMDTERMNSARTPVGRVTRQLNGSGSMTGLTMGMDAVKEETELISMSIDDRRDLDTVIENCYVERQFNGQHGLVMSTAQV
jgi:hypothetical protein